MSIASELTALAANKAAIKAAITAKNPSVMPTDALSQWPTSIATISGSSDIPYDAELDYVTFPVGAYVDPEIEDYGGFLRYDFEISMRLPSDYDVSTGFFRCGNWRGEQTTSFMLWPRSASSDIRICQYWSSPDTGYLVLGQFMTVGTHRKSIKVGATTVPVYDDVTYNLLSQAKFLIGALDNVAESTIETSTTSFDVSSCKFSSPVATRRLIAVRKGQVGYLYDQVLKKLYGSATSTALVPGPDKVEAES